MIVGHASGANISHAESVCVVVRGPGRGSSGIIWFLGCADVDEGRLRRPDEFEKLIDWISGIGNGYRCVFVTGKQLENGNF